MIKLIKKDLFFAISILLALISTFFVLPDKEYFDYINFPVLILLFCLMIVVAGFEKTGVFDILKSKMSNIKNEKTLIFALCMLCFFVSALVTNDVALITFVPFSLAILKGQKQSSIIFCVVMETISANLGSLLTPIGNPQNLYLYTTYSIPIGEFFKTTLPLGAICFLMICVCFLFLNKSNLNCSKSKTYITLDKKSFWIFSVLFVICILSVLDIISCYITLIVVTLCVFFIDKTLFKKADYILLLTFVCFFVFSGNVARIPEVYSFISKIVHKNDILATSAICQIISNVPAAAMLSSFTDNGKALIIGTNIGGLGTLIASMASLISYRYISRENEISKAKYVITFSIYNFIMLFILLLIYG